MGAADPPLAWVTATGHLRNIAEGEYFGREPSVRFRAAGGPTCRSFIWPSRGCKCLRMVEYGLFALEPTSPTCSSFK